MMEEKEEVKPIDPETIRRPFVVKMEAGVAKRFIKACQAKGVFVRETVRQMMIDFSDSVLGKEEK
jgi:hypothetical protein